MARGKNATPPRHGEARRCEIHGHNQNVNFTPPEPLGRPRRRKLLWLLFWFILLTSPVLVVAGPPLLRHFSGFLLPAALEMLVCLSSMVAGATVSGFLLARLMNEDTTDFIRQGFGYSFAFALLHLMIVFVLMNSLVRR